MTKTELATALANVAPTYYMRAPKGTAVPYIVYSWNNTPHFPADDVVYQKVAEVDIEFYFKDLEMLDSVDAALDELVEYYVSATEYEEDEKLYIKTYTMEVIDNG